MRPEPVDHIARDIPDRSPALARWSAGLVTALLVGALAGCSGGGPDPAPPPASPPVTSQAAPTSAVPTSSAPSPTGNGTASKEPEAPATTPTPGSTAETVPSRTQSVKPPVKVGASSSFGKDLGAEVSDLSTRSVKAVLPGEVSGSSVVFTVTVRNRSSRVVDLNQLVVNLTDGKGRPTNRITSAPATKMPDAVAGDSSTKATYVFVVGKDARKNMTIEVSLRAEDPVLVFKGSVD